MAPCGPLCASDTHSRGGESARQPLVSPRLPPLPRRVRYGTVVIRGLPFRRRRSRTVWPTQLARRAPPSVGRAPANDRRVARDWPVEIYAAAPPPRSRRSRSRLGGNGAQGDDSGGRQRRRACAVFGLARTGRLTTAYVDAAGLFGRGGRGGHPRFSPRRANVVPCTSTPAGGVGWSPGYAREGGTNATAPRNGGGGTSGPVA